MDEPPLQIVFASPAWWPSRAFGGPVVAARELVRRLVAHGHSVKVLTTTIVDVHTGPSPRTSSALVDGADVRYLATPIRYRWMGITPSLPAVLVRMPPPDVAHVFGFRDPVTTFVAAWCRVRGIPYVFEPLGMFRPRLRKVRLKQTLDATLYRGVAAGAARVVVSSELERDDVIACGVPEERVRVRGNGFPAPPAAATGGDERGLRERLGIASDEPIVLYVGRIAAGKGLEHLEAAARAMPTARVVLVGPDDGHGMRISHAPNVHLLPATDEPPFDLYRAADVFVLPSAGESFGMAAAEAAAVGTPVVVTDRCGIASSFGDGEAVIVPYERAAIVDAIRRVVVDATLREELARGGMAAAARLSWDAVSERQEAIYREAIASRTASRKPSTLVP